MMDKILDSTTEKAEKSEKPAEAPVMKQRPDQERDKLRKRERKALMKSLQLAQVSTASMGKFDKKANKHEPDAPNSQKIQKKKSNSKLYELEKSKTAEKERNMKILNILKKEKELSGAGNNQVDNDKLAKMYVKKTSKPLKKK